MKKIIPTLVLVSTFFLLIPFAGNAQPGKMKNNGGNWVLLGTVSARGSMDHDVIRVRGPYDYFRKLKFRVSDSRIEIREMVVTYDDRGGPERIAVRQEIPKGGESRVIDLRGGKRKLRSVEFWYSDRGFLNGRADLTLFGIK
jgi:hypothetical protein